MVKKPLCSHAAVTGPHSGFGKDPLSCLYCGKKFRSHDHWLDERNKVTEANTSKRVSALQGDLQ